jgi:hypothetical protein
MNFTITIERLCRVRGRNDHVAPSDDADGFRSRWGPWHSPDDDPRAGTVATPAELAKQGSLVLLGEPGMGKTTALSSIRAAMPPAVDLEGTQITAATFDAVLGAPLRAALPSGGGAVVCIIDQVDESPELARLGRLLRTALAGVDASPLCLVMACRTADLPPDLIGTVTDLCGAPLVADLLPLSRAEAEQLASSALLPDGSNVDGAGLVAAAVAVGAGAFAATPLTLGLLVSQYGPEGKLSDRASDLYAAGAEELAQEWQRVRETEAHLSVNERLTVAEEIAARLVLTGRRSIWTGPVADADAHHDVRKDLAITPDPVAGTNRKVDEVLATALFTGRGADRLGFVHSSIAAYLAACYLVRVGPPERQLRSLFLVEAGEGRVNIPVALRETAAWLVTLDPKHAQWLVDADAESLAAHRSALDTPGVRKLIVDVLLRRADEVELSNHWGYQYRSFGHPDLGEQIGAVLDAAAVSDPKAWPTVATVRVALRLATGEHLPQLMPRLLAIASEVRWPAHIRARAASIAAQIDADAAALVLREVLSNLGSEGADEPEDPRDEIRFAILDDLWPSHVTTAELLPELVRPTTDYTSSTVRSLRRRFAAEVPDHEIPEVMRWAARQSQGDGGADEDDWESDERVGHLPDDLAHDLVDRAFAASMDDSVLADIAMVCRRTHYGKRPPLPLALAEVADDGNESEPTRDLRRRFALALLRIPSQPSRFDAWELAYGWGRIQLRRYRVDEQPLEGYSERTHLLDADDFAWAYGLVGEATDPDEQDRLGELASVLAHQDRLDVVELLASDPAHPLHVRLGWILATPLNTPMAEHARQRFEREQAEEAEDGPVPGFDTTEFLNVLNTRLGAALAGDTDKFVQLLYQLRYDPTTGRGKEELHNEPLASLPAVHALGRSDDLTEACRIYLNTANDDRDRWLGTNRFPFSWWAAEMAFAHLVAQDALDGVADGAWTNWIGVVLEYHYASDGHNDGTAQTLLDQLYRFCPDALADALRLYARREIRAGKWAGTVARVAPTGVAAVAEAYEELLDELTEALAQTPEDLPEPTDPPVEAPGDETRMWVKPVGEGVQHGENLWRDLFAGLCQVQPERCQALALRLLDERDHPGSLRLAALAGGSMLLSEPAVAWPYIQPLAVTEPALARRIVFACGDHGAGVEKALSEADVADLYRLLASLFPPETETLQLGAGWVGPQERAREWRDRILGRLADRGTAEAVATLRVLSLEHPTRLAIKAALINARRQVSELTWQQPTPQTVGTLLADSRTRLVESDEQLAKLIVEALEDIQRDLPQICELLWDRITKQATGKSKDRWVPKIEAAIGAFVAHELRSRLARGIAVNREVLVIPTSPDGAYNRVDIKLEARDTRSPNATPPTVMVELKGSWHQKLKVAQDTQLRADYLSTTGITSGVYLVAWFDPASWSDDVGDTRRTRGAGIDLDAIRGYLSDQAVELGARHGVTLHPVVLTVDLPAPAPKP